MMFIVKMDLILLSQEESLLKGLLLAELWHRFLCQLTLKKNCRKRFTAQF